MSPRAPTTRFVAILAGLWLAATGLMAVSRLGGIGRLDPYGQGTALVFIAGLIVFLWRAGPAAQALPRVDPIAFSGRGFGLTLCAILAVTLATFALGFLANPWLVLIVVLDLLAAVLIFAERARLTTRLVTLGMFAASLCLVLSAAASRLDVYQGFYLASVALLFTGGGLLLDRSGLTRIHLASGQTGAAAQAFLIGGLLAVPAALLNVSYGAHSGDGWVDRLWEPAMALVPGIAEESWARLFLLTLLFILLQPSSAHRPKRALALAVALSALVHALAHYPAAMVFSPAAAQAVATALVFGLPMGLLFLRNEFEAAVGYHVLVDFVRFCVAFWQGS